MTSYSKDRDEFIAIATREQLPLETARALLRASTTLHKLAEAECNGDWPCDNGQRETRECPTCGSHFAPAVLTGPMKDCPNCRTERRLKAMMPDGFGLKFNGDPRGCVLKLTVPSGFTNDWGREGVCVPCHRGA